MVLPKERQQVRLLLLFEHQCLLSLLFHLFSSTTALEFECPGPYEALHKFMKAMHRQSLLRLTKYSNTDLLKKMLLREMYHLQVCDGHSA